MITLCIRYTIDQNKLPDFEAYAKAWPPIIARCGGRLIGYYLPTKIAGPTNFAMAIIDFESLAAYQCYRDKLGQDPDAKENVHRIERTGCILNEDRAILQRA